MNWLWQTYHSRRWGMILADIEAWNRVLNSRLEGIASVHYDHEELYNEKAGRCFGLSNVHDTVYFYGESFAAGVVAILVGEPRGRNPIRPGPIRGTSPWSCPHARRTVACGRAGGRGLETRAQQCGFAAMGSIVLIAR
jgi:hypothetical protein